MNQVILFFSAMLIIISSNVQSQDSGLNNNKLIFYESNTEQASLGYSSSNLSLKNDKDFGWTIMDAQQRLEFRIKGVSQTFIDNNGTFVSKRFTRLGSDAPKIKMKVLTGTSSSSNIGATQIAHGLGDANRILGVELYMNLGTVADPTYFPPEIQFGTQNFTYFYDKFNITVQNNASTGTSIQSKPIRILMTYTD